MKTAFTTQKVTEQMLKLSTSIQGNKQIKNQLDEVLGITKYGFVHLDWESISINNIEYMLVLTKDEVKIMEYTSYNKFKEVSIKEVAERVTTEDMAHIIRVLDSAISKVEEGKLPYYI